MTTPPETTRQITAQISAELAARIDAIRARLSIDGTPGGGPPIAMVVRQALDEWASRREEK